MTRAARGGLLAGPTVDRRLVVVVRVAIVAFTSLSQTRISRPHRHEHYLRGRAHTRSDTGGRRLGGRTAAVRRYFGAGRPAVVRGPASSPSRPPHPTRPHHNDGQSPGPSASPAHLHHRGGGHGVHSTLSPPPFTIHQPTPTPSQKVLYSFARYARCIIL